MNNKGQIIMPDILLYIIILTMIFALLIYANEILNDNQVTRINNRHLTNILDESISTLTKTSGNPYDWENLNNNKINIIGLKSDNNQLLSYNKLIKLKNNPQLLDKLFPDTIDYSVTIYPKNNPNDKEINIVKGYINNKKQVLSKNTLIIFDYDYDMISFNHEKNNTYCPFNHDNQWVCKTINIDELLLKAGKYYIISDSNIEYILSNTYSENITGQTTKICINNQLEQLRINENQTIHIHIKANTNNTYLVYDRNDCEEFLESVIKPESYILNIKIAT